ncbi:steroid 17-alpha-hydroxylase/17,20 lyase-like [Glandiceps talaboti]
MASQILDSTIENAADAKYQRNTLKGSKMISAIIGHLFSILSNPSYVLLLLLGLLVCHLLYGMIKPAGFPPGPIGWPVIGSAMLIAKDPHTKLTKLSEKYGDIFTLNIGLTHCVVLNNIKLVRESLVAKQNDFAGRPYIYSSDILSEGRKNIVVADFTPAWKYHRKLVHQAIRNYASGERLERAVSEDALPQLMKTVEAGEPFDPTPLIFTMIANIICNMSFGKRYAIDDPELKKIMDIFKELVDAFSSGGLLADLIPFLRYIPRTSGEKLMRETVDKFLKLIQQKIDEHKETFDQYKDNHRDLIDDLLHAKFEAEGSENAGLITDVHIRQTIADVFGAGLDTTVHALNWCVAYLMNYPDVQAKVHDEIDNAIGRDRPCQLSDRSRLPYCEAVIHETMRIRTVAPIGVPHTTTCDTSVGGYCLPRGTWIMVNQWKIHMTEKEWKNPEEFRPERFLTQDGTLIPKAESYIPFSAGRRVCVGEALAKNEMFLMFVNIFQNTVFTVPPGSNPPSLKPNYEAAVIRLFPYKAVARKR